MNKPKTKEEVLAQLEELKAYIAAMPDDVERDLTDIKRDDEYYWIDYNNISSFGVSSFATEGIDKDFPATLRTRSREHLDSMKKYRDTTAKFMAKCHEVNLNDSGDKRHEVYYLKNKGWRSYHTYMTSYPNPLAVTVSEKGAEKLIAWCEREYPNGLDWTGENYEPLPR